MQYSKTYYIDNLTCHDCCEKIVDILHKNKHVINALIDFDNKEITIVSDVTILEEEVKKIIDEVMSVEHVNNHILNGVNNIITDEYLFEDIDCPNCAAKVERALNKNINIIDAQVNFINKKIIVKHKNEVEVYNIVNKIVKSIEVDAKVIKGNKNGSKSKYYLKSFNNKNNKQKKHEDEKEKNRKCLKVILFILGVLLYGTGIIYRLLEVNPIIEKAIFIASYLLISYDILYNAFLNIIHLDFFSESTLMIIASVGAVILDEPIEGVMVIILFKIGEYCQDLATSKSKRAIQDLIELKVDKVTLKDGTIKQVEDVNIGEVVTIKVGERIPLDGVIKEGNTDLDMKSLTGESIPVETKAGEEILSGAINLTRVIDVEVTRRSTDSTISKVKKLVEEASNQKATSEKFITKFARIYTPCILIIAVIVAIIQRIIGTNINDVFNNFFTILVISCPCALVISIPLGYYAGIGRSSKSGILVKGGNYLEALTKIDTIVFDKTGTITKGQFKVIDIKPEKGYTKNDILRIITEVEQYSIHPIASSLKKEYGKEAREIKNASIEEKSGEGLILKENQRIILVGNERLMISNNIDYKSNNIIGTVIYLAINQRFCGSIVIGDELKESSESFFKSIHNKNYTTVMLTGDNEKTAEDIKNKLHISKAYAKLLPYQKYEKIKEIINNKKGTIVFVGDGINDTPALKLADVGIAMGALGSDSAKEASDIVIMNDDISKIGDAVDIAKFTRRIVIQNIIFSITVKVAALVLAISNVLSTMAPVIAIFADVGTCILAIINVTRILRYNKNKRKSL